MRGELVAVPQQDVVDLAVVFVIDQTAKAHEGFWLPVLDEGTQDEAVVVLRVGARHDFPLDPLAVVGMHEVAQGAIAIVHELLCVAAVEEAQAPLVGVKDFARVVVPDDEDRGGGAGCQDETKEVGLADKNLLNIRDILDFANTCDVEDVKPMLDPQIQCNSAISEEGLLGNYGANIGSVLLRTYGSNIKNRAVAKAAAGSDARMNGCELPVVINSGSGNQGITVSVPVIEYAKELNVDKEKLYRALVLSNLIAIHEKTGIGRLSAYCGAVSAGCAAGCGIAYLHGEGYEAISHTLVNSLAIVSGIICDGAKASCAAKIASSVEAGLLGYAMYKSGNEFKSGDGIVNNGVEATIRNVSQLGREGMKETDKEIIRIMLAPQPEEKE